MNKLKIGIKATLVDGDFGGTQQFIIGLAQGLSQLTDGEEEYIFLVYDKHDWLKPYVKVNCRLEVIGYAPKVSAWRARLKEIGWLVRLFQAIKLRTSNSSLPQEPESVTSLGLSLMHFPTQSGFITPTPSIYHPWDLQHIHLPQFFTPYQRAYRETTYRFLCHQAQMVSVATTWGKQDLIAHYGLDEAKVSVVPMASVLVGYPVPSESDLERTRLQYQLPPDFIYYPAQTWEHKNHKNLLLALKRIKEVHQIAIPLVLTGKINANTQRVIRDMKQLGLEEQVKILGYVPELTVQALYRLCRLMVFPSRFEGWGLPLTEAMSAGVPIACSNVVHLPDLVGDAGVFFSPDDVEGLASQLHDVWTNEPLRARLSQQGKERANLFSWEHTARLFRAHYRRLLGVPLSNDDAQRLSEQPLV